MKSTSTYLVSALLLAASSCQKCEEAPAIPSDAGACGSDNPSVKSVTDGDGFIGFDATLHQYYIQRSIPGTIDAVDVGFLCGTVPASLQAVGKRVQFSGTYKPYDQPRPFGPAGRTFYYLEVASASVRPE